MRRFWLQFGFILLLGAAIQPFTPWWSVGLVAFAGGALFALERGMGSFLCGFLAALSLWSGYALYLDVANGSLLSEKVGRLMGGLPPEGLVLITGLLGGLVGGSFALTGTQLSRLWKKRAATP